jgi:hypothetical protein
MMLPTDERHTLTDGQTDKSFSRWATLSLIPVAALAVALRLRMLLVGRSLWLDETALALNICGRSFAELLRPLDHDQAAPIGFLFIERAAVLAFGPGEVALRFFPFLASIAVLYLIHRLCAENLGRWSAVMAVALAGVMPALFYYSGELKQYSSDVASALLILVLASGSLHRGLSAQRASALALAGMVVVWISHPSVFVLAGAGTTLILKGLIVRRYRVAAIAAAVSACWLASFAVEYVFFLKDLQTNNFLADYWESAFLKFPPTSPADLRLYPAIGFGIFEALFHNAQADVDLSARMGIIMAAAWMIGVATLYRQGRRGLLGLLVAPLVFAIIASMLHKYPLKSRLALFTAASTLPIITAGFSGLMVTRDPGKRVIGGILLGCALLLPSIQGAQFLLERPRLHDARSVLEQVARAWQPGDVVVVDPYSALPFLYYKQFGQVDGLDRVATISSKLSLNDPEGLAEEIARWKGRPRVWFLLDTALPDPINLSRGALKVLLDQSGERMESFSCRRYSAHLYRLDEDRQTSRRMASSNDARD